ncbi:MAG: glycosyltransferase family 4 protein [Armatimonadetes bacterium]|nr:glycosyltransferase family 4 protein [Armatimonadota bacterium]
MRIAIDCRTLLERKTGDRTYTMNLVRHLPEVAPEHEFVLLFHRNPEESREAPSFLTDLKATLYVLPSLSPRLWTAVSLPRFARREQIDLLHLQYIVPPLRPCKLVTTIHDMSFYRFPDSFPLKDRILLQKLIPWSARAANRVLTGSASSCQDIIEICKVAADRVAVIPYGVDDHFQPVREASEIQAMCDGLGIRQPYLLFVGVLQPRKNLTRLLQAYQRVRTSKPQIPDLVIAGKRGWMEKEIFETVETLALSGSVQFVDYVPDEMLPTLYSAAKLLIYPSLYEGFGLPVVEAMACGTPVVTSNLSSLPEVAGGAAVLVDPRNVDSIAEGIRQVLEASGESLERMRASGVQQAAGFSWLNTARLTAEVYRSVLSE